MTATEKRKQMVDFIKKEADEQLVEMVYDLVQNYINNAYTAYELTDEQVNELDKDQENYRAGKGKNYSPEEVHQIITGKFKK